MYGVDDIMWILNMLFWHASDDIIHKSEPKLERIWQLTENLFFNILLYYFCNNNGYKRSHWRAFNVPRGHIELKESEFQNENKSTILLKVWKIRKLSS